MSENGYEKSLRKRTVEVPDRNYTSSADGSLPRRGVSVAAAPWELEDELNKLGVVEPPKAKGPILKGPRPGMLKPDAAPAAGKWYRNGEEPEF